MAIASITLFFNNPSIFTKTGTKIRRGLAVDLIYRGSTFDGVKDVFEEYAITLSKKNGSRCGENPKDNTYLDISTTCAEVSKLRFYNRCH